MVKNLIIVNFLIIIGIQAIAQERADERERMVKQQLISRGIRSKAVLDAMRKVERHRFVPTEVSSQAYNDYPLPIGEGQTISQPYIVAFMTEALELKPTDKVLEVGTGSGYQAAILAEICREVYTIEIVESLGKQAAQILKQLGYTNVHVRIGDGYFGWPEAAPFDAIIVTCSPSDVPEPLQQQLAEGGRMIIPVGEGQVQELVLITKQNEKLKRQHRLPVLFVPMRDKKGKRY
ncbi:MAG: protein-L-isoaspartate(D-aspartate) O-methyltransferase [Cyclobacteriaceae bacterium]|nr:protein-L-isoaspartate(D-aspartate) O-methyltransferase [Cyclobacteriaceae bacterium]MCX7637506.1 protein-L-isoaspartate(D-aspartate) O-methyltransferase [Cyclobacteriaceae bacterium]MDW8332025.1 protein-L-isoaspartate(D-aspartate) O-methyltransferase [Cyclobacteriaceae bacterium]